MSHTIRLLQRISDELSVGPILDAPPVQMTCSSDFYNFIKPGHLPDEP
jgi:hypothetical protein